MKSFLTLMVVLSVAIGAFYAVTSSNLLVRYSYEVYACASPSGEMIELKFNDIEIGENIVITSANGESTLEILQASEETVMFKKQKETFTLERVEKRLLRELDALVSILYCDVSSFRM
jgi:transcriptional antiterminator Rof (Rho-off)